MENSVKTSDEILNELFESIKPNEDSEASEGSVSLSEGEDKETPKKAKKSKKDKKSKKKKKEKKKKRSPERKSRPLSPVQDRSRRDHKSDSRRSHSPQRPRAYENEQRGRDQHDYRGGQDQNHRSRDYHDQRDRRSSDHYDHRVERQHDHREARSSRDYHDERDRRSNDHYDQRERHDQRDRRSHDHYDNRGGRSYDHHDRRDGQDPRDREYGQRERSQRGGRDEQRPPKRSSHHHEDPFWDNRWDALQMQKKADEMEKRGRHFLDDTRKRDLQRPSTSGTKRRKSRSPTPDTEELKRLKKMKQIQDLVVKEEEKYVAEPLDPELFEWDDKVKMWKRKSDKNEKSYEEELKERMEEQFKEGKRKCDEKEESTEEKEPKSPKEEEELKSPKEEPKDPDDTKEKSPESKDEKSEKKEEVEKEPKKAKKKIDETKMSLDEIEEIRKKREKFKKEKEKKDDKEEGEIDEDGEKEKKRNYRKHREEDSRDHHDRDRSSRSRHHEKSRRSRSRSRDRNRRSRSRDRSRRSRSRDRNRRSRSRDRYRRSRSRDDRYYTNFRSSRDGRNYRSSDRYSSRSSRARSRSPRNKFRGSRTEIDKAKLLAIAKKNAVKLLSSDNLMGMDHEQLIAIKSGGQNLRQLTDFCRELAAKGITDEFDDDDDILYGNLDDFHHPFEVKDKPVPNPYTSSGIYDEKLTPAMKKAAMSHRMIEFPVSSGNAHRVKEADVIEEPPKAIETVIPNAIEDKSEKSVPEPEPEISEAAKINAKNPLGVIMFGGVPEPPKELEAPKDPTPIPDIPIPRESRSQTPKESGAVFDAIAEPSKDISSIVSERLTAMKRLSENPQDPQALKQLYEAQKEMSNWAESKNKPGQFTGHTGAKILTHAELSMGVQAWARQEQFTKAQKVQGGFGEYLLKKMGWSEGEGLGKTRSGDVDPLTLDIKMDKKGFMAAEEDLKKRRRDNAGGADSLTLTACKDLSHKHPVSGLMELSTKRKWGPPNFVQIFDCGPPHKKQYIFKVTVNGEDFQPTIASENKKKAKADAATVALQEMGLLPKDPNNPL